MLSPRLPEAVQPQRVFRDDQLVYFMLKPDEAGRVLMDAIRRAHGLPRKYTKERFHVTLVPLGDIRLLSPAVLKHILLAAESFLAEPFPIAFDRLKGNSLKGSAMRPVRNFQHALVAHLKASGLILPDYDFDPHVTLAYTEWEQRNVPVDPIGWTANELLLINSVHGKGHELLGSWNLEARQGELQF